MLSALARPSPTVTRPHLPDARFDLDALGLYSPTQDAFLEGLFSQTGLRHVTLLVLDFGPHPGLLASTWAGLLASMPHLRSLVLRGSAPRICIEAHITATAQNETQDQAQTFHWHASRLYPSLHRINLSTSALVLDASLSNVFPRPVIALTTLRDQGLCCT